VRGAPVGALEHARDRTVLERRARARTFVRRAARGQPRGEGLLRELQPRVRTARRGGRRGAGEVEADRLAPRAHGHFRGRLAEPVRLPGRSACPLDLWSPREGEAARV
jgi:hypothetical protein